MHHPEAGWILAIVVISGLVLFAARRKPKRAAPSPVPPLPSGSSFQIDPKTGDLVFEHGTVVLARLSNWRSVPTSFKVLMGPERDMRTGWKWRGISPLQFEGEAIAMSLGYHDDRLEMVNFSLLPPDGASPWDGDPVEEEKVLRRLVEASLGIPLSERGTAQYKWGSVYCGYDPKSMETSAGINYTFFG